VVFLREDQGLAVGVGGELATGPRLAEGERADLGIFFAAGFRQVRHQLGIECGAAFLPAAA